MGYIGVLHDRESKETRRAAERAAALPDAGEDRRQSGGRGADAGDDTAQEGRGLKGHAAEDRAIACFTQRRPLGSLTS